MEKGNLNIVLIGMPGAGKTYIGGKLAKLLAHFTSIDTDQKIEEKYKMKISEIFDTYGEEHFRKLEENIIEEIAKKRDQVISIGGGAYQSMKNINALKENGLVFYLKTSPSVLFKRIEKETHRPLLQQNFPQKALEELLKQREKKYRKANFIIDTDNKQAYTILDDILREYENYVKQKTCC